MHLILTVPVRFIITVPVSKSKTYFRNDKKRFRSTSIALLWLPGDQDTKFRHDGRILLIEPVEGRRSALALKKILIHFNKIPAPLMKRRAGIAYMKRLTSEFSASPR